MVRMPARMPGIFSLVWSSPVATPDSIPASNDCVLAINEASCEKMGVAIPQELKDQLAAQ